MATHEIPVRGFKVHIHRVDCNTVVKCSGRLTAEIAPQFQDEVRQFIPKSKQIILDLSELHYMDSAGLGAVVGLYVSGSNAGCVLKLVNFNERVRALLGVTNLLGALQACGTYMIKMP